MKLRIGRYQIITALVIVCVGVASAVVYLAQRPHIQKSPPKLKNVISNSTATPSEAKVTKSTYNWQGSTTDPKYITLPSISAEGFIQNMGIDQNNQVAAPTNVNFAGWYVNSVRPGEDGLSIIDGHVDGLHGPGIFINLNKLKSGDTFSVEFGDNSVDQFEVRSVSMVPDDQAAQALFSRDNSIQNQLNLITCGGTFDKNSQLYTQRVIVVSEKI